MDARDRYRIVGELGQGGVAEVLEAIALGEHGFERRVALKRLRAHLAEEDTLLKSFIDEARIASRLHHANIVAVLDFGVMDGAPFQVIELVDGLDARALLDQCALPLELALYIALQVAQALAYAHDATAADGTPLGIVHRDVKPKNVLISWTGDVKLADFGIAFAKKRLQMTEVGFTKGTLRFMAPEQALGGTVDRRTDVFALGCLLHALATGGSPFGDDPMEYRPAIAPSLPDDVRAIVEKSTRFAMTERHDNAEQLGKELARALARRASDDSRAALKRLLDPLRPKRATPKAHALLDVELLLGKEESADLTPVRRFSSTIAKPPAREEPQEETTRPTILAPQLPVPKTSPPLWRIIAWTTLVILGVANLTVMLMTRRPAPPPPPREPPPAYQAEPTIQPRKSEPEPKPEPEPEPDSEPDSDRAEEPRPVRHTARTHEDPKPKPIPTPQTPTPQPPTRDELRTTLQSLRDRLERLSAHADAASIAKLETRFLDLSTAEAKGGDLEALARATRAFERELAALEHAR